MGYTQLSLDERYQIKQLHRGAISPRKMATQIRHDRSTISRELLRNHGAGERHEARSAQRRSMDRRHTASAQPRIDARQWSQVEVRLREDRSPDQIAGSDEVPISHERIYQNIADDRQRGGTLWTHLWRRKLRRRHRCSTPRQRQRFG